MKHVRYLLLIGCYFLFSSSVFSQTVKLIFDTDMGPDYDDVGALAMVHVLQDQGKVELLSTMASTNYDNVGHVLAIINSYFGKGKTPIGVSGTYGVDLRDWQFWSDSLVSRYDHYLSDEPYQDAVRLYRELLSRADNGSVTIVTVGFLSNIAELLRSKGDDISPLSGKDLMHSKVKALVSMAGKFPEGMEFNIEMDAAYANYVNDNWKGKWVLSGFEIGDKIHTGLPLIHNNSIVQSPIKDVYSISIPMAEEDKGGRMSWDQTAVLVAALGAEPFYTLERGKLILKADGYNYWEKGSGNHYILLEKTSVKEVEDLINTLMMHVPLSK
jgi:inosine-uridine nucleoside N-ribohydrolase